MRKPILAILLSLAIVGCGKDKGSPAAAGCGAKDLFSNWSNSSATLSLFGLQFNQTVVYQIQLSSGEICQMDLVLLGGQCSGSGTVSNASYAGGGSGDPGCSTLNGPFTFTKTAAGLSICDATGCESYQ